MTTFHISTSIRGALAWSDRVAKQNLEFMTDDKDRPFPNVKALRERLRYDLAMGKELIACKGCNNFDPKTGCKGHKE